MKALPFDVLSDAAVRFLLEAPSLAGPIAIQAYDSLWSVFMIAT